jgi:hypothetical protein
MGKRDRRRGFQKLALEVLRGVFGIFRNFLEFQVLGLFDPSWL